ncbi:MAG: hypothetical protein ABFD97_21920, partial [Syntrophobacter sp.]
SLPLDAFLKTAWSSHAPRRSPDPQAIDITGSQLLFVESLVSPAFAWQGVARKQRCVRSILARSTLRANGGKFLFRNGVTRISTGYVSH